MRMWTVFNSEFSLCYGTFESGLLRDRAWSWASHGWKEEFTGRLEAARLGEVHNRNHF